MIADIMFCVMFIYILCYTCKMIEKPRVPILLTDTLMKKCPAVIEPFKPISWAPHSLMQSTMMYRALHDININDSMCIRRELIASKTLDTMALDWIERTDIPPQKSSPIVINFSGVSNCATTSGFGPMITSSIQDYFAESKHTSVRTVNVIYPGFNGHVIDSNKVPGSCFLSTDTVGIVLRHLKSMYPDAPLVLVGWSFGGALISNWLSRNPEESATFNISVVIMYAYGHSIKDTVEAADVSWGGIAASSVVGLWRSKMFDDIQNFNYIKTLEDKYPDFSLKCLKCAKTVLDWDIACLPLYGFDTIEDMYDHADPAQMFQNIRKDISIIIINADDDWLCPSERVKKMIGNTMPNVAIIETKGGGHLGWIDNIDLTTFVKRLVGRQSRNGNQSKWLIQLTLQIAETFLMS